MTIVTTHQQGFIWHHRAGLRAKGYLFDGRGTFRRGEALLDHFSGVTAAETFARRLREANGCFAVIVECEGELLAAVDPVRSMPLFHAVSDGALVLGDDVYAIQKVLGGAAESDPVAREEFLRVGFTIGSRTIDPRVSQVEAGEFFRWDKPNRHGSAHRYFSHAHDNYTERDEEALVEELDQVTSRWAKRLIHSVEDRTIVIPLSGGYDSRYIACALKREGYENVVCYSYGTPTSFEWHIAQDVALRLGYPIHIVEYNHRTWRSTIESPRFIEFCRLSAQRCAIPHIQDIAAREQLEIRGVIPANGVVVPGYCGDLLGGSYVPVEVRRDQPEMALAEGIDRYLLRTLFDLRNAEIPQAMKVAILGRIGEYTSQFRSNDIQEFCSVLEDWFTRHKVAKFVVNSVRTHEMFGNEWRLPLWDTELIDWWYRIPLRLRVNSVLYHRFLFERLFGPMDVAFHKGGRSRRPRLTAARRWLPADVLPAARWLYRRTLGERLRKQRDIDAFGDLSSLLLRQLPGNWSRDDFANVNGVVATWCEALLTVGPSTSSDEVAST